MNSKQKKRFPVKAGLVLCLAAGAMAMQSCSDDVLTGQPSWLGNSIYEELANQGNYTTELRLIDDLGLREQMSHTGSQTLFAADDDTFAEWFRTNTWGVRSYEQLSTAQKKLLLNSAVINNAYLIELMSNVSSDPPLSGRAMRRTTSSSVFDSVAVMHWQDMNPNMPAWQWYVKNKKDLVLFRDGQMMSRNVTSNLSAPMIHFLPAFMQEQNFTDEDITLLSNGVATSTGDAYIGGHKVVERDITCKNGYIHKMDGVIEPFQNMAQIVHQHANTSMWANLIDRFSAPYYDQNKTTEYNRLTGSSVDSVFTLRYFASSGLDNNYTNTYPATAGNPLPGNVPATLTFDPGWNQYMYDNTSGYDLHYDAGAMLVPTNDALNEWWNRDGKALQDMYGSWDNVPDLVLSRLINVNMLGTFTSAIPSNFANIMNDAKVSMGVTTADVDSAFLGCNGVVYLTNRVFTPMEYSSVSFPALIHQDVMSAIYEGIDEYDFLPYLNSMDSYYSLLLPTNNALLTFIDPCGYGDNQKTLFEVRYDSTTMALSAQRYACTIADDGTVTRGPRMASSVASGYIKNRMNDLINQLIIVGDVESGYEYYKTKQGSLVRVANAGKSNMTVSAGWQLEHNNPSHVTEIYDMSQTGNGKSYVINTNMPEPASKSVYQTLSEHDEYSEFLKLLSGSDLLPSADRILLSTQRLQNNNYNCLSPTTNANISLFANYNYTVYVPSNASILQLEQQGVLPTWDDYDALVNANSGNESDEAVLVKNRILDFVRYHIQDNSVAIDMAPETDDSGNPITDNNYESMMLNESTNRYYPLDVHADKTALTITDRVGNTRNVVKDDGLYNNICREYWLSTSGDYKSIYATADAVVHLIDGPLFYSSTQLTPWKSAAKKYSHRKR